jgi:fructose-1,6-bisphosphatase I
MKKITLDEFRLNELRLHPDATNELSSLLREISQAAKLINSEINKGSLGHISGGTEFMNSSGDPVKKLDQFANHALLDMLENSFGCAGLVSEEIEHEMIFKTETKNKNQYVVVFDPLDGSGNIDNCLTTGSIFGIYRRVSDVNNGCNKSDFLQKGNKLVAAGYIVYGSSTMMVYATKRGVNGFTLDNSIGEFCLTHRDICCPDNCQTYSINESKMLEYDEHVIKFIRNMQEWNADNPGTFKSRYVGTMVADLHRTLIEGGIFLYPGTKERSDGKLRLVYECNPFAFIFHVAGGRATNGHMDILDIEPKKIHQRTPFFIGNKRMMTGLMRSVSKTYSLYSK